MKRGIWFIAAVAIAGIFGMGILPGEAISESVTNYSPDSASGRIIVKLEEGVTASDLTSLNRENDASIEEKLPVNDLSVVDLPGDLSVTEAVERYEDSPNVEYAEPDYEIESAATPNDSSYSKLWGLNNTRQVINNITGTGDADIDGSEAWNVTTGSASSVVAIIDSGVDINHPDLNDNVWTNPGEIAGNNKDDDDNGYVDDVHGWDFHHNDNTVFDSDTDDRHGTHVAGTIAAEQGNGTGITGVAPRARIMPLKFIGPGNKGYTSSAIQALNYAVANGAKISNNSYGLSPFSQSFLDAIKAADAKGHLFVSTAGNSSANNDALPRYPSSYNSPNIISVAASTNTDQIASFSNYGATTVDLAAPGEGIYSTFPGNTYGYGSGTSMAAPHVAGVAALVKSKFPELDDAGIKARLLSSVDKKTSLTGKMVSGGRLNAAKAVGAVLNTAPVVTSPSPHGKKVRDRTPTVATTVQDSQTNLTKSGEHGQVKTASL